MKKRYGLLPIGLLVGILYGAALLPVAHAATCTQTVTNTNNSGAGSLRQAITSANSGSNADYICFSIGSGAQTIAPTTSLPPLNQPVTIDGTTQPGWTSAPIIEINAGGTSDSNPGLWINTSNSTLRGLVINRAKGNGVMITGGGGNTVAGNYIGIGLDGTTKLGNQVDGVGMITANNTIGGTTVADRNVISGNAANGIGITNQAATGNKIIGNYAGTNAAGTAAIPNYGDAILLNNSQHNDIGGTTGTTPGGACTGSCNLFSGNTHNGIGFYLADNNSVKGNFVGLNASGTSAVPNDDIGIESQEAAGITIGNATAAGRNVISGNKGAGILLTGSATTGNVVAGNFVGTNSAGTGAVGNYSIGISVGNSPGLGNGYARNNTIGGTVDAAIPCSAASTPCNVISGNGQNGMILSGGSGTGNLVLSNHIGLDINGASNANVRNGMDGIGILNSPNNTIGNDLGTGRNYIGANGGAGIVTAGDATDTNTIAGNYIGRTRDGYSGNAQGGVVLWGGYNIAIVGNSIGENGGYGIDIDGNKVSQNDAGDGDAGVNHHQNFPDVYSVRNNVGSSTTTTVSGMMSSAPNKQYRIDFFNSAGCNAGKPDNYGEGNSYVGSQIVGTDQFGNISFSYQTPTTLPGNTYLTTTATLMDGSSPRETSEFSKCRVVNASKPAVSNGANWLLKDDLTEGVQDQQFGYGFPPNMLLCAWDPAKPGTKLPVVVSGNTWFFRASYTTGVADKVVSYGPANGKPVCGDWNGDGIDTIGMVDPAMRWTLRNSNDGGPANADFQYGGAGIPVVGDWNGDGRDTIGVFETDTSSWRLRNENNSGVPDYSFQYGGLGTYPVVGNWNGGSSDGIGTYNPGNGEWSLRNTLSGGPVNTHYYFGQSNPRPMIW
ncbi:hypothetical protein GII36_05735 [Candidatus Mycosynbacter amalyticus]|uniref:Right handed beta helix domain-containing protein n=2 Tax=Candidatus Mycosynbacter amalyticus TaxID=2665156 RepID=A0A857MPZ1_9BACT|nr:hypothetical protein GII36_05735 [Candidatus Mycosynbacter amalyticus]